MSRTQKIIILILATAIFSIVIGWFLIMPLLSDVRTNSHELLIMREKTEEFYRKTDVATASSMYGEMSTFISKTKTLFLKDKKPISVLVLLTAISQNYDIEADIRFVENVEEGYSFWPYMRFEVLLEGDVQEMFRFLREVEVQEKLVTIEAFEVKEVESEEILESTFISKIMIRFYY